MALLRVGLADEDDEVGPRAVGDEGLGAVDDVFVAVADRRGADAGDVGAGAGLGDPEAADLFALQARFQVLLLLLLGAEQVDRGQDHVGLDREAHVGAAGAGVAHALGADQRVEVVAALAAVLLREAEAEEAELARPLHRRGRPVGVLPLVAVRPQLLLHPRLHRLAQVFVLLAEDEVLAPGCMVGLDDAGAVGRGRHWCLSSFAGRLSPERVDSSTSYFQQSRLWWRSMSEGNYELVAYEVADGVATVTLNNPEKRNMLSGQMLAELVDAMKRAKASDEVRAVVLTGAGDKVFCAGADLGGFAADAPLVAETLRLRPLPRVLPADAPARQALALRRQRPRAGGRDGARPLLRPGDRQRGRDLRHAGDQRRRLPLHDHVDHLPQRPAQEGQRDDAAGRAAQRRAGGRVRARQQGRAGGGVRRRGRRVGRASWPPRARC